MLAAFLPHQDIPDGYQDNNSGQLTKMNSHPVLPSTQNALTGIGSPRGSPRARRKSSSVDYGSRAIGGWSFGGLMRRSHDGNVRPVAGEEDAEEDDTGEPSHGGEGRSFYFTLMGWDMPRAPGWG